MYKYEIELLAPAWRELEEIADIHLALVGAKSAKSITDKILDDIPIVSQNLIFSFPQIERVIPSFLIYFFDLEILNKKYFACL